MISWMCALSKLVIESAALCALTILLAGSAHATGGKLLKVTMDYTGFGNKPISADQTITTDDSRACSHYSERLNDESKGEEREKEHIEFFKA